MQNLLWADIQAQPDNLTHVIQHLYQTERANIDAAATFLRNDRPTYLIGVASAQYLCMPAENFLARRGKTAQTLCASDAIYSFLPALKQANIVINSRSGETAEIVKLARLLAESRTPFVAVTNEPRSTLAGLAAHVVWADTRKDDLVSINVVTGMMTATLALAAAVTGELDALRPEFSRLAEYLAQALALAAEHSRDMFGLLGSSRPLFLLYRGCSKGAAYCGRLVLEEVARTPSIAMGAAEFRQGPNEVVDERFGAVIFAPSGPEGDLNRSLCADILHSGGQVVLVGEPGSLSANPRLLALPLPHIPTCLAPILEVVPVQFLAFELARAQGYEPGQVRYITKIILEEAGIPNQIPSDPQF